MPSLQQQAIKMTREAINSLFVAASHVPADKQTDWVPMGAARTTLSQLVEVALTPYFFVGVLQGKTPDFSDPNVQAKRAAAEAAITTVELAKEAAIKNHEMLYSAIESLSDEDLDSDAIVPWSPTPVKKADVIFYTYWNIVYHMGQINYIQLLLGDTEMHMS